MKMLDVYTMRSMLLEYLEDTRYKLSNNGYLEVNDIHFGSDTDEHDHIYTEYGYYNEAIQNVPDTEETLITPGIFAYDGADIINNPDYECYNAQVALEFLAFEKQRSAMRLLLESYVNDIKGKVVLVINKEVMMLYIITIALVCLLLVSDMFITLSTSTETNPL